MLFCECGTGSFKHADDEDAAEDVVGCTGGGGGGSPSRERRKHGGKVNPYAERGLDRFSVVLSELETRRAKILRRVVGSVDAGLVLVRFVPCNGDWTPVVVKIPAEPPPSKKKAAAAAKKPTRAAACLRPPAAPASPRSPLDQRQASPRERGCASSSSTAAKAAAAGTKKVPARKASFSWGRRMRRPSWYWPSVVVLTLVSLAVSGRVFAICAASIWWYVLPAFGSGGGAAGEDARRGSAGMRMSSSMEKKKAVVSVPLPYPHAKKG